MIWFAVGQIVSLVFGFWPWPGTPSFRMPVLANRCRVARPLSGCASSPLSRDGETDTTPVRRNGQSQPQSSRRAETGQKSM